MSAAPSLQPHTSEPMTWLDICAQYPDEWVCLVDIGWLNDTDFEFTTARVIGHGKRSGDPYEQARPVRHLYHEVGHFFTGAIVAPVPRDRFA
jgi:hypothetical protein